MRLEDQAGHDKDGCRDASGHLADGATLQSSTGESGRVSGILAVNGAYDSKRPSAEAGDTIALGKLDPIKTGDTICNGKTAPTSLVAVQPTPGVLSISRSAL